MNPVMDKIETLPAELKAIIENDEIISIIDEIGDGFDIPYHWRSDLVRATVKILSGVMRPGEFIPFIMEEYNMEQEDALQIALAINERIFSAVKPQLASLHNIEDTKLAHSLKVPKKPRLEEIAPATEVVENKYREEIPTVSAEVPKPYIPPVLNEIPSPIVTPPTPIMSPLEMANTPSSQVQSTLSGKLDSLRVDQYREKF